MEALVPKDYYAMIFMIFKVLKLEEEKCISHSY